MTVKLSGSSKQLNPGGTTSAMEDIFYCVASEGISMIVSGVAIMALDYQLIDSLFPRLPKR
jgi:hypothetical protein